jgi:hypothetical protein
MTVVRFFQGFGASTGDGGLAGAPPRSMIA